MNPRLPALVAALNTSRMSVGQKASVFVNMCAKNDCTPQQLVEYIRAHGDSKARTRIAHLFLAYSQRGM